MNINIVKAYEDDLVNKSQTHWERMFRRSFRFSIYFIVIGILTILYGVFLDQTERFWNFFTSIGISEILAVVIIYIQLIKYKSKYFNAVDNKLLELVKTKAIIEYTISDSKITTKTDETYSEISWQHFKLYEFYKNYILLFTDVTDWGFIIDKNDLTETDYFDLEKVIKLKLQIKK